MELSAYSQDGTIALYFVLPVNCKPEECTKTLIYAFQACREHELEPTWISTQECLKMLPTKQDVFVCDPFDGDAFKHFMSGFKCVRVLGPRCLLTCLHSKKPVPELPSPLHNMAMHGIVATSTGFEKEAKAKLQDLVERMCGIYSNSFHEGITHLIANVVGTKKYLVAVEKETPIMSEEWVKAVWKATNEEVYANVSAIQDQFSNYTCPVFKGLVVCVSQLPRKEKDALKSLIEGNGGTYAANLEMSVTSVLISPSSEGEKYKHALQWRIPCLTQEWIYDSLENGHALPWDAYKIQKKPKASTPTNDLSIRGPPDVSICSTIMNETMMNNTTNVDETVEQDISLFLKKTPNPGVLAGVTALENLDLQKVLHAGLFLDGCKIFVSGFDANLQEKLRRILNAGGATRFNTLTDAATHIVIGKVIEDHISAIRAMSIKPHVVTADWLVECANEGRPVDEEKFSYLKSESSHKELSPPPPASTTEKGFAKPNNRIDESKDETAIDVDLINQYLGNAKGKTPRRMSLQENSMDCSALPDSQESTNGGIFGGKIFTISGYSDQIEEQLEEIICGNGGEVVDINCSRAVTYSVVSVDGEGLFHPKALNYITHIFLEDCLEQECLVPVEYFHLPFIWPSHSTVLSNCVIATSVYKGKERPFLNHIASKLGATCQDMFARKDNPSKNVKSSTHLLCPSPEGSKYAAAKKWGVPAVTKDWVLKCAANGYKVLEEPFSVDNASPEEVDCKEIQISLLDKAGKLHKDCVVLSALGMNGSLSAPIALDRKVKEIRNQHNVEQINIQTPDSETIRRMYPTPGCRPANESLDAMPTPDTPYGSTWFENPSSRIRKGFKRALDALPDDVSTKRRLAGPETPDEVYYNKYTERLKEVIANHPLPKPPSGEILACPDSEEPVVQTNVASEPVHSSEASVNVTPKPTSDYGPLFGVVVYASKKLTNSQQELYRTVEELGGNYRWTYDSSVTHFLHYGRMNDTNKEFRIAKESGKMIVAPDWVWMCRDEGKRVDESLFPHVHNPKMSLSIISTKSTPCRKKRGRPKLLKSTGTPRETPVSEEESAEDEEEQEGADQVLEDAPRTPSNLSKEELARQLEELETLALVTGAGPKRTPNTTNRSKSVGIVEKINNTPGESSTQQRATGTTEPESQGTAITWDDPQEREARARLQVALVGETEDILAERKDEMNDCCEDPTQNFNSAFASSRRPKKYVFALSGMDEERVDYINMIHHLGGSVVDNKAFDLSITHIITLKPTRSEKHLAAIASGRWILYKSFLECSISAEHFVEEELHEWGNEKAVSLPIVKKDSMEEKLALAAHRWRVHFDEVGRGAFHGMKVVFYSSKERIEAFTRLVEAGGGQIIKNIKEEIDEVTHCFVELSKAPKVDLALFASKQIPCILPMYLNNLLISFPPPDEMESCIPEYKEIIQNMTTPVHNLTRRSKRKGSNNC